VRRQAKNDYGYDSRKKEESICSSSNSWLRKSGEKRRNAATDGDLPSP